MCTVWIKSDICRVIFRKRNKKCREIWDLMMERTGFEEEVINNYLNKGKEELEGLTQEQIEERNNLLNYYGFLDIKTNQNARNVLEQLFAKIYRSPDLLPDFNDFDKEGPDHAPTHTVRLNETITLKEKKYLLKVEGVAGKYKPAAIKAAEKACDILYLPYNKI